MKDPGTIGLRWRLVKASLNEDQRRLWLGSEAQALGEKGVSLVAREAGVSRTTVTRGKELIEELSKAEVDPSDLKPSDLKPDVRQRRSGGGRRSLVASQPGLLDSLLNLFEPAPIRGIAPPLLWTTKSREKLAEALREAGHHVRGPALGELLKAQRFRVRGSATFEGNLHRPVPVEQFQFINDRLVGALQVGWPVLGVELFRVTRSSAPVDDEPGFDYARYRRRDERFADEPPVREDSDQCVVCGASKGNLGWLTDPDITTVGLVAQALNNWWATVGTAATGGAERLVLVVGGMNSEEAIMLLLLDALRDVARKNSLPLEVLRLPAGTTRWRAVAQRFSMATNCYDVGRSLERHEVFLEQPASSLPKTTRASIPRQLSADGVTSRKVDSSAHVVVDSKKMMSYPSWNCIIPVD